MPCNDLLLSLLDFRLIFKFLVMLFNDLLIIGKDCPMVSLSLHQSATDLKSEAIGFCNMLMISGNVLNIVDDFLISFHDFLMIFVEFRMIR